jgi:hypothetical protein
MFGRAVIAVFFSIAIAQLIGLTLTAREEFPVMFPNVVSIDKHCTGFIVPGNYVVTARHCVREELASDGLLRPTVYFFDGMSTNFDIVAVGSGEDNHDWAVLRGDTRGILPFEISPQLPKQGDRCAHVGYGGGSPRQLALPCIVTHSNEDQGYIGVSSNAIGGDSGSPIFNLQTGVVFGIVVRSAFPIPHSQAVPILEAMVAMEKNYANPFR